MEARSWINADESGREMLSRLLTDRPYLYLPPPFHKLPLRVGNVMEIVGPSPSAKTLILIHSAINCILPQYWNGVHYAGFGHSVFFYDLDCRFDILLLSQLLKSRIVHANRLRRSNPEMKSNDSFDDELFVACMKRFHYIRCYDSLQFLATLKTLHYQLQKEREAQGNGVNFMMIDSIGAFYWIDRSSTLSHREGKNRKSISFQNVSIAVVQEIKKLMLVHPMIVLATKANIRGNRYAANEVKWNWKRPSSLDSAASRVTDSTQQFLHREYMPAVWQSFVTLRVLVQPAAEHTSIGKNCNKRVYLSQWMLPSLSFVDKFFVEDGGIIRAC